MDISKDLFSPSHIRKILEKHSLALTNRFGQNFLINQNIARRILEYADLNQKDSVLEIGPGLGTLTFFIADLTQTVLAIEIDRGLARYLKDTAEECGLKNIFILGGDFLKIDPGAVYNFSTPEKVISNFPFNIALKAILRILEEYASVRWITGTVQQEIAERIVAKPGQKNYSYVSVYLQFLTNVTVMDKHISPKNFIPPPEVESSIIKVERVKSELPVGKRVFKRIVKASFRNRRKSLLNNLLALDSRMRKEEVEDLIRTHVRDVRVRAENLSVHEFVRLARELQKFFGTQS
jgi:16S rRNA (adenine1518-N6/adenine1519-N6)-dimethyltransferase